MTWLEKTWNKYEMMCDEIRKEKNKNRMIWEKIKPK